MPDIAAELDFEFYSQDLPNPELADELWAEAGTASRRWRGGATI